MTEKSSSTSVARPPPIQSWLLPVPLLLAACMIIGALHMQRFGSDSLVWGIFHRSRQFTCYLSIEPSRAVTATLFVPDDGPVVILDGRDSWDGLHAALRRSDGKVWSVSCSTKVRTPCLLVPCLEHTEITLSIGSATSDTKRQSLLARQRIIDWLLAGEDSAGRRITALMAEPGIRAGRVHTWRPLWGYIVVNIGIFGGLLLLPFSLLTWRSAFVQRQYFKRLLACRCVRCGYALISCAVHPEGSTRCPECGTLNPMSPTRLGALLDPNFGPHSGPGSGP